MFSKNPQNLKHEQPYTWTTIMTQQQQQQKQKWNQPISNNLPHDDE